MLKVDVKHHHTRPGIGKVYGWQTLTASAAIRMADPRLRCPACKGAIGLYSGSDNGRMPERGEHRVRNQGCPLGDCYDGNFRIASLPIEPEQESYSDE